MIFYTISNILLIVRGGLRVARLLNLRPTWRKCHKCQNFNPNTKYSIPYRIFFWLCWSFCGLSDLFYSLLNILHITNKCNTRGFSSQHDLSVAIWQRFPCRVRDSLTPRAMSVQFRFHKFGEMPHGSWYFVERLHVRYC